MTSSHFNSGQIPIHLLPYTLSTIHYKQSERIFIKKERCVFFLGILLRFLLVFRLFCLIRTLFGTRRAISFGLPIERLCNVHIHIHSSFSLASLSLFDLQTSQRQQQQFLLPFVVILKLYRLLYSMAMWFCTFTNTMETLFSAHRISEELTRRNKTSQI